MAEYDKTGAAVSDFVGFDVFKKHILIRTCRFGGALAGGGKRPALEHRLVGISRQWQRSVVGSGVWTNIEQATGLNYVVAAADKGYVFRVVEYDYNYAGFVSSSATPTEPVFVAKTGVGKAVLGGTGSGGGVRTKTGVAVSDFNGTGPGGRTHASTGAAVSPFTGAASKAVTDVDTGAAVAPLTGGGVRAEVFSKPGRGVSDNFTGGGTRA